MLSTQDKTRIDDTRIASVRPLMTPALLEDLRRNLAAVPGARIVVKELENGPPIDAPIVVRVFAEDLDTLTRLAAQVEARLQAIAGTHSVNNPLAQYRVPYTVDAVLAAAPIDLICLGIGENGHLAFNDPPVADFADPARVKVVALDDACRRQQVNDGCFPTLADVPTHALTLTLPVFRDARRLSAHVPGQRKAAAVRATLRDPRSPACPATLLRDHLDATLYVDEAAAAGLQ